jgi:hypothetical protein
MIFKWETEEERISRFMKIPPRKKLEWLFQMHNFIAKFSPKYREAFRRKLRASSAR